MREFTLIVPYYLNQQMLKRQLAEWEYYPSQVKIILVDDGSPIDALSIVNDRASDQLKDRLTVYRILVDIPWNRGGARNLGTKEAQTDWIIHVDIDHVLPADSAARLLEFEPDPSRWYRFNRYRKGRADETRRKDKIPDSVAFGQIHPHIDSYLCAKGLYWQAGGYNEDFSGCLGGGSPFLAHLERVGGKPQMAPADLHVYTRDVIPDASDYTLSRDRGEFSRRKQSIGGDYRGHNHIRFPWTKQSLCTRA